MNPAGPQRPAGRGLFLTLEGPDGSGKTTQSARIADWLTERGLSVTSCRDPGGTRLGDRLRSVLLDRHDLAIGLRAEMLLYMASRAQLVEEVIRPALDAGHIVVSDRYLLSNVVYQGCAGGLDVDEIWAVGRAATGGLQPDLTIVLDVPVELAAARIGTPRDRIEDRPMSFRAAVRHGFLELARTPNRPIVVVDGAAPPEVVTERIRREVERVLGQDARA